MRTFFYIASLLLCVQLSQQQTYYVKPDKGCVTSCDGSWADPYDHILQAIKDNTGGITIELKKGASVTTPHLFDDFQDNRAYSTVKTINEFQDSVTIKPAFCSSTPFNEDCF